LEKNQNIQRSWFQPLEASCLSAVALAKEEACTHIVSKGWKLFTRFFQGLEEQTPRSSNPWKKIKTSNAVGSKHWKKPKHPT